MAALAAACFGGLPARAAGPVPSHLAVALLLDTSGSMTQNDPADSRVAAARQVAAALGPGDRFALIGFADTASVLLPLTPMGTPAARAAVDGALGKVGAAGATDILGAITTGVGAMAGDASAQDWHVLILITDGVPDLPSLSDPETAAAYRAHMEAAARDVAGRGWVLDTVGLGPGVDAAELGKLAALGGGEYQFAPSAADLTGRLLSEFNAVQARAQAAPPPKAQVPPTRLTLQALPVSRTFDPGQTVALPLRASNAATGPVPVQISARALPPGWSVPPVLTVPPGDGEVALRVTIGRGGGPVTLVVAASAPEGTTLGTAQLSWALDVRPAWQAYLRTHGPEVGAAGAGALLAVALVGYLGYLCRIRPLGHPRGRLEVTAPGGERLGSLRLPRCAEVVVGASASGRGVLRLAWVSGEDRLFRIRVEMDAIRRPLWLAGLRALVHPPQAVVYAEAEWPYHLYPGPRPQRRVELYDHTSFGAAGLTFTFRSAQGGADGEPAGSDLLRALDQG